MSTLARTVPKLTRAQQAFIAQTLADARAYAWGHTTKSPSEDTEEDLAMWVLDIVANTFAGRMVGASATFDPSAFLTATDTHNTA